MVDEGSRQRFHDPIALSDDRELATLEDAARFILNLPKAEALRARSQRMLSQRSRCAASAS